MKRPALPYVLLLLFLMLFPLMKIADYDFFFHLRLGERLWETGGLYRVDEFSFASQGRAQYTGEWLSNGLLYAVYKYSGFYGLGLFKSLYFIALALLLYGSFRLTVQSGESPSATPTILSLTLFAYAIRFRLDLRPYIFTYLFLALFAYSFLRYRQSGRGLWPLPIAEVVWANMHGGFILGPLFSGLFLITEAFRLKKIPRGPLLVLILVAASSGLNPAGFAGFGQLRALGGGGGGSGGLSALGEWQSVTTGLLWGYGLKYTWGFQVLALGALIYLLGEAFRRRFDIFYIAVFAVSVFYAFMHVRLTSEASVLIAPLFYLGLKHLKHLGLKRASGFVSLRRLPANAIMAALLLFLTVFSVIKSDTYDFGFGPKPGIFPDAALRFLDDNGIGGRGFNTVTVGSYMLWAAPERKVFIDGRLVLSKEDDEGYDRAIEGMEGFDALDDKFDFNYAIVAYGPRMQWRFPAHMNDNPRWALIYWDETSVVYLKRKPENDGLIDRFGYRVLRPSFYEFAYLDIHQHGDKTMTLALIDEDIERNPFRAEARLAKAYFAYYSGRRDEAFEEVKKALAVAPENPHAHVAMAQLLNERGNKEDAVRELKETLRLDPYNELAKALLKAMKKAQ